MIDVVVEVNVARRTISVRISLYRLLGCIGFPTDLFIGLSRLWVSVYVGLPIDATDSCLNKS